MDNGENMKKVILVLGLLLIPALALGATLIISNQPLNKEDARMHFITGNALMLDNQPEAAVVHFEKAVNLKPGYEEALSNLAYACNQLKDYGSAADALKKLVELRPDNPSYHYDYAVNLALNIKKTKHGEIDELETAINELDIVEELSPGFMKAAENRAFLENMLEQVKSQMNN